MPRRLPSSPTLIGAIAPVAALSTRTAVAAAPVIATTPSSGTLGDRFLAFLREEGRAPVQGLDGAKAAIAGVAEKWAASKRADESLKKGLELGVDTVAAYFGVADTSAMKGYLDDLWSVVTWLKDLFSSEKEEKQTAAALADAMAGIVKAGNLPIGAFDWSVTGFSFSPDALFPPEGGVYTSGKFAGMIWESKDRRTLVADLKTWWWVQQTYCNTLDVLRENHPDLLKATAAVNVASGLSKSDEQTRLIDLACSRLIPTDDASGRWDSPHWSDLSTWSFTARLRVPDTACWVAWAWGSLALASGLSLDLAVRAGLAQHEEIVAEAAALAWGDPLCSMRCLVLGIASQRALAAADAGTLTTVPSSERSMVVRGGPRVAVPSTTGAVVAGGTAVGLVLGLVKLGKVLLWL